MENNFYNEVILYLESLCSEESLTSHIVVKTIVINLYAHSVLTDSNCISVAVRILCPESYSVSHAFDQSKLNALCIALEFYVFERNRIGYEDILFVVNRINQVVYS